MAVFQDQNCTNVCPNRGQFILMFPGSIEERPVVRDGAISITTMATLSMTYDHRVLDGMMAANP